VAAESHLTTAVQIMPLMRQPGLQTQRPLLPAGVDTELIAVVLAPGVTVVHPIGGVAIAGHQTNMQVRRHGLVATEEKAAHIMLEPGGIAVAAGAAPITIGMQPHAADALRHRAAGIRPISGSADTG